jgi:hypothetical protein
VLTVNYRRLVLLEGGLFRLKLSLCRPRPRTSTEIGFIESVRTDKIIRSGSFFNRCFRHNLLARMKHITSGQNNSVGLFVACLPSLPVAIFFVVRIGRQFPFTLSHH